MNIAELLDSAGTKLSLIDIALGRATERQAVGDHDAAQKHITAAHTMLAPAGLALMRVAMSVLGPTLGAGTSNGVPNVTWQRPDGSQASVPPPQPGEGIMGYAQRVTAETGYPANAVGAIAQMSSTTPFKDWPHIVDYLADPKRYMTAGQRAVYDAQVAAASTVAPGTGPHRIEEGVTDDDAIFLYAYSRDVDMPVAGTGFHHRLFSNSNEEIARVIGRGHPGIWPGTRTIKDYKGPWLTKAEAITAKNLKK